MRLETYRRQPSFASACSCALLSLAHSLASRSRIALFLETARATSTRFADDRDLGELESMKIVILTASMRVV